MPDEALPPCAHTGEIETGPSRDPVTGGLANRDKIEVHCTNSKCGVKVEAGPEAALDEISRDLPYARLGTALLKDCKILKSQKQHETD